MKWHHSVVSYNYSEQQALERWSRSRGSAPSATSSQIHGCGTSLRICTLHNQVKIFLFVSAVANELSKDRNAALITGMVAYLVTESMRPIHSSPALNPDRQASGFSPHWTPNSSARVLRKPRSRTPSLILRDAPIIHSNILFITDVIFFLLVLAYAASKIVTAFNKTSIVEKLVTSTSPSS